MRGDINEMKKMKLVMKKVTLLFLTLFLLSGCNKTKPQLEIDIQEYLNYQEIINNKKLEIDLESYMYCKDSTTIYSDSENGEIMTECKVYEISIQKLLDDIIYEVKQNKKR